MQFHPPPSLFGRVRLGSDLLSGPAGLTRRRYALCWVLKFLTIKLAIPAYRERIDQFQTRFHCMKLVAGNRSDPPLTKMNVQRRLPRTGKVAA